MANLERIYTIPLGGMYEIVRQKRWKRAVKFIRDFALRHMKAESTRISEGVNSLVLRDGIQKPPRRIKVRIVKDDKSLASVWLIGEEEKQKELAEKKKKEEEAARKEQEKTADLRSKSAPIRAAGSNREAEAKKKQEDEAKKKADAAKADGAAKKEAPKAASGSPAKPVAAPQQPQNAQAKKS
ncbi:50S ribosomal protein L31e [uncultured archaeon]|nr:50S ribosomal protein L31e [uncultured archaeon]